MAEILHQLRLVVYPVIYKVLYIPGGFLARILNHQQLQYISHPPTSQPSNLTNIT